MNMSDSWEFASGSARGEYVIIMADRWLLRKGALATIARMIQAYPEEELFLSSFPHLTFRNPAPNSSMGIAEGDMVGSGAVTVTPASDVLHFYAKSAHLNVHFIFPPMCYRREAGERMRKIHGRMVFPVAPDKTSLCLLLLSVKNMVSVHEPLVVIQTAADSNTSHMLLVESESFLRSMGIAGGWPRCAPIKAAFPANVDFDDFLFMRRLANQYDMFADVDWVNYFLVCWGEILGYEHKGFAAGRGKEFRQAWKEALRSFDETVQRKVHAKMFFVGLRAKGRAMVINSPFLPLFRNARNVARYHRLPKQCTAFAAAGFGDWKKRVS
jgi:hypothetical protein